MIVSYATWRRISTTTIDNLEVLHSRHTIVTPRTYVQSFFTPNAFLEDMIKLIDHFVDRGLVCPETRQTIRALDWSPIGRMLLLISLFNQSMLRTKLVGISWYRIPTSEVWIPGTLNGIMESDFSSRCLKPRTRGMASASLMKTVRGPTRTTSP